jgi:hypothetical protein
LLLTSLLFSPDGWVWTRPSLLHQCLTNTDIIGSGSRACCSVARHLCPTTRLLTTHFAAIEWAGEPQAEVYN